VLVTLALFWIASGLIGFWRFEQAVGVLTARSFSADIASICVGVGSVVDCALGVLIAFRRTARLACFGMAVVAGAYLAAAGVFASDLFADPLGPMVKVFPALVLALIAAALLEDR
jgi:hypothetical protein